MTPEQQQAIDRARALVAARQRMGTNPVAAANEIAQRNQALANAAGVESNPEAMAKANAIAERDIARTQIGRPAAAMVKAAQGGTFGFNDEILGAVLGDEATEIARHHQALADKAYPVQSMGAEIAGAVVNPVTQVLGPTTGPLAAAKVGGVVAATEAAGNAEGSVIERLDDAAIGGALGFFTAGLADVGFRGLSKTAQKLARKTDEIPTIEGLRAVRDDAYRAVRQSGVGFDLNDMTGLNNRIQRLAKTARWDIDAGVAVDDGAVAALKRVGNRLAAMQSSGKPISLNNLDKMRQNLFDIYNRTDHPFVLQIIGEVDNLIDGKAAGNEVMQAARAAHRKYAQAQLLHNAFEKAERQTAATGSGGNILNKYRQAVNRIIDKPAEAKYFAPEQLEMMRQFVMGDMTENALRRAGKLAPGGNGLMTALNVYAAAIDPTLLAVTAAASGAKAQADRSAMRGSKELLESVSTGVIKPPSARPNLRVPAVGVGSASGYLLP